MKLCDVHQKAVPAATREPTPAAVHVCAGRCHRAERTDTRGTTAPPSQCAGLGDAGATVTISKHPRRRAAQRADQRVQ